MMQSAQERKGEEHDTWWKLCSYTGRRKGSLTCQHIVGQGSEVFQGVNYRNDEVVIALDLRQNLNESEQDKRI